MRKNISIETVKVSIQDSNSILFRIKLKFYFSKIFFLATVVQLWEQELVKLGEPVRLLFHESYGCLQVGCGQCIFSSPEKAPPPGQNTNSEKFHAAFICDFFSRNPHS